MFKNLPSIAAIASIALASPAFAHAKLLSTSPADGAQLTEAPKTLSLTFAELVKLALVEVGGAGQPVPITLDRAAKATATVVVRFPALAPGRYEVHWSAVSPGDGHVSKGSLVFTIQPATH